MFGSRLLVSAALFTVLSLGSSFAKANEVEETSTSVKGAISVLQEKCSGRIGFAFASSIFDAESFGRTNADGSFDLRFGFTVDDVFYRFITRPVAANVVTLEAVLFEGDNNGNYKSKGIILSPITIDYTKLSGKFKTALGNQLGEYKGRKWRVECN